MAHFPKHVPVCWEFIRGESVEHHTRRLATERQHREIDRHRRQGTGLWWTDQRYVDQVVPSHFTDPKTFDNFNYRYQLYARHPVQRPAQCLSEATDKSPPIRYNVKRIAVDKPFRAGASVVRRPGSSWVELPPLSQYQVYTGKQQFTPSLREPGMGTPVMPHGKCHSTGSTAGGNRSETTRSPTDTSYTDSYPSPRSDCNNNNNHIDNDTILIYDHFILDANINTTVRDVGYNNNTMNDNNMNDNNNVNNNSSIRNQVCYRDLKLVGETCQPGQIPLEVIEAFPKKHQGTCRNQGRPSTFLCRPTKAWPEFPCNRMVPGERMREDVEEDEKKVLCRRILR